VDSFKVVVKYVERTVGLTLLALTLSLTLCEFSKVIQKHFRKVNTVKT